MEGGALARLALDPGFAAVGLDNMFDDCQPQAGAPAFAGPGAVHPVEPLEYAADGFGGDSRAVVGDEDLGLLAGGFAGVEEDAALRLAVFDGVFCQVENTCGRRSASAQTESEAGMRLTRTAWRAAASAPRSSTTRWAMSRRLTC